MELLSKFPFKIKIWSVKNLLLENCFIDFSASLKCLKCT